MSLEQIYTTQIKHNPINNFASSFGGMPQIERDPTINKLERDVMQQLQEIMPKEDTIQQPQTLIKTLSPEEALKELMELEKAMTMVR
jgi:hypothetical protein